jgi:hypothetical protein
LICLDGVDNKSGKGKNTSVWFSRWISPGVFHVSISMENMKFTNKELGLSYDGIRGYDNLGREDFYGYNNW